MTRLLDIPLTQADTPARLALIRILHALDFLEGEDDFNVAFWDGTLEAAVAEVEMLAREALK